MYTALNIARCNIDAFIASLSKVNVLLKQKIECSQQRVRKVCTLGQFQQAI